jgi:hypothetical protein
MCFGPRFYTPIKLQKIHSILKQRLEIAIKTLEAAVSWENNWLMKCEVLIASNKQEVSYP